MPKKEQIILPEKYYLGYFLYLLDFIKNRYNHILDVPELLFYSDFDKLSEQAKCLYIRLINRKGPFFRFTKIQYDEIENISMACEELNEASFLDINGSNDPHQLTLFTRKELLDRFPFLHSSQRKIEMLEELTESDLNAIHQEEHILEVKKVEIVEFLKLLFFGNRYQQMTEFVIRDIGNIKLQQLDEDKFTPWFETREDALSTMHISQLKPMIKEAIKADLPLHELLQQIPWERWMKYPRSKVSAEKLLLEIGAHFEKYQCLEEALGYYQYVSIHPSGERKIRILEKLNRPNDALEIAQQLIEKPSNATELTFALDYLNRSGIRIDRSMTQRLKKAKVIDLKRTNQRVETAVLKYFEEKGWNGVHSENFLWRGLFGLTFWQELFDEAFGSFHHPLQRQPSDLHHVNFFSEREHKLKSRLSSIRTKKNYLKYIVSVYQENQGNANRFVHWHDELLPLLEKMIHYLPLKGIKKVLLEIAKQTKENSTGFPDLFIWNEEEYHFYEVKSPNDHLSAQQLFWINFLSTANINAEILKINYIP